MPVTNVVRWWYRVAKKVTKKSFNYIKSINYRKTISRKHSDFEYTANLLIVKNPIYAPIAKVCVESFLHFNPKCKVVIHVDSVTGPKVKMALRKISKSKIEIRQLDNSEFSWQEIKLDLILKLGDKNEFFMDADLRWNGPIPELKDPSFFVEEFILNDRQPYPMLLEYCEWPSNKSLTMKNTSFVYWGSFQPVESDRIFIEEAMLKIHAFCNQGIIQRESAEFIARISEQIALSVMVGLKGMNVTYLKSVDGFRDGSFVESSYFGATGSKF